MKFSKILPQPKQTKKINEIITIFLSTSFSNSFSRHFKNPTVFSKMTKKFLSIKFRQHFVGRWVSIFGIVWESRFLSWFTWSSYKCFSQIRLYVECKAELSGISISGKNILRWMNLSFSKSCTNSEQGDLCLCWF
jgi:hypothetical protein